MSCRSKTPTQPRCAALRGLWLCRQHQLCNQPALAMLSMHRCAACLPACRLTQYAASKLCNILHTRELQDRYQQSRGIIATSCSPGFVNTTIFRQGPEQPELAVRQAGAFVPPNTNSCPECANAMSLALGLGSMLPGAPACIFWLRCSMMPGVCCAVLCCVGAQVAAIPLGLDRGTRCALDWQDAGKGASSCPSATAAHASCV